MKFENDIFCFDLSGCLKPKLCPNSWAHVLAIEPILKGGFSDSLNCSGGFIPLDGLSVQTPTIARFFPFAFPWEVPPMYGNKKILKEFLLIFLSLKNHILKVFFLGSTFHLNHACS